MTPRYAHFQAQLTRAHDMVGLAQSIRSVTFGVVDSTDMLRSALVQVVAALDHYVHGVVLDRGVDIAMSRRTGGKSKKLGLSLAAVSEVASAATVIDRELAIRTHLAARLSLETFQRADAIGQALADVGVPKVWSTAFPGNPEIAITNHNLIVTRRNQIVHAGDADPLSPGALTPMSDQDAIDAIATIEAHVAAIDPLC